MTGGICAKAVEARALELKAVKEQILTYGKTRKTTVRGIMAAELL